MDEMIRERKDLGVVEGKSKREEKWDLLTNLIAASEDDSVEGGSGAQLSFNEVKGWVSHSLGAFLLIYI